MIISDVIIVYCVSVSTQTVMTAVCIWVPIIEFTVVACVCTYTDAFFIKHANRQLQSKEHLLARNLREACLSNRVEKVNATVG